MPHITKNKCQRAIGQTGQFVHYMSTRISDEVLGTVPREQSTAEAVTGLERSRVACSGSISRNTSFLEPNLKKRSHWSCTRGNRGDQVYCVRLGGQMPNAQSRAA